MLRLPWACARTTTVSGTASVSGWIAKSNSISTNGLFRPRSRIAFGSALRITPGISSSRVANAKSSCRYSSPAMLICVVSLR